VHHGLSRHADAWVAFCETLCASLAVPLVVQRVVVPPGDPRGVEAAARSERHAALRDAARRAGLAAILVAHHQDDQAETLLLQLARGSGPAGLAAMARARRDATGLQWLRPFIDLPRSTLEAYVRERGLRFVDDESNASTQHRRNALRENVVPPFAALFPGYPATLARAAVRQAEALALADDLAALDFAAASRDGDIDCERFAALAPHRARNLLRYLLRLRGLRPPSEARLAAMVAQVRAGRRDARVAVRHDGSVIGAFRGRIVVHPPPPPRFAERWSGQPTLRLAHGELRFTPSRGDGLDGTRLAHADVTVRQRAGGERLQPARDRPRRALKAWLRDAAMPPWVRAGLPLVFCDGELAAVPGIGVDVRFAAPPGAASIRIDWSPSR
jgi:tRNA(Ile)-lysidine synthase